MDERFPARLVVVAGTYDGVLAGWDTQAPLRNDDDDIAAFEDVDTRLLRKKSDGLHLKLSFATAAHSGSVRCLAVSPAPPTRPSDNNAASSTPDEGEGEENGEQKKQKRKKKKKRSRDDDEAQNNLPPPIPEPGTLLSGGFDDALLTYDLRRKSQTGELKAPAELGSPLCCSFAPPGNMTAEGVATLPTHALVGTTSGKIVLYRKRDWSVQHVLSGHEGPVNCLAVHPSGRAALSGGLKDGRLCLWDLTKGRLAFVHKLPPSKITKTGSMRQSKDAIHHVTWSDDGRRYAFCHSVKITARDASTGEDLLDVTLPSRANQCAFVGGPEGIFVAAACDDGGLPLLEVGRLSELLGGGEEDGEKGGDEDEGQDKTRRAIMAIEPVDRASAGEDRFKCIRAVAGGSGFLVVTANSGGVVSLYDLEGAARMMLTEEEDDEEEEEPMKKSRKKKGSDDDSSESDDSDDDEDDEVEAAVEILDSVKLGSGARITDLAVWSYAADPPVEDQEDLDDIEEDKEEEEAKEEKEEEKPVFKRGKPGANTVEMDAETVEKARKLVGQAKKRQKKQKKKKKKSEE